MTEQADQGTSTFRKREDFNAGSPACWSWIDCENLTTEKVLGTYDPFTYQIQPAKICHQDDLIELAQSIQAGVSHKPLRAQPPRVCLSRAEKPEPRMLDAYRTNIRVISTPFELRCTLASTSVEIELWDGHIHQV